MKLALSWPPKELLSNSRVNRHAKGRAAKKYRTEAAETAWAEGWHLISMPDDELIQIKVTFCPPDRRQRDFINMQHSVKSAMDGLADALRVNDKRFRIDDGGDWGDVVKGGAVRIEVRP